MKRLTLFILLLSSLAIAEDDAYQLLRSDPEGYGVVRPGLDLEFPKDHLPHPDFRIEWWYLTANLEDEMGRHYGVHWTLFRQSMSPADDPGGWQSSQVWMAHTALSAPSGFHYEERFARGGIGQADVRINADKRFEAWLDNWTWTGDSGSPLPGELVFTAQDFDVALELDASTPWVLQGDKGYSQKSALGQASYYYSQPHIRVRGSVKQGGASVSVTGDAWLDREWSSQPLAPDQPGWDWLSVHLADGHALMVYRLRQQGREDWISGSWVTPSGESSTLGRDDIVFEPLSETNIETPGGSRAVPLHWRVALPDKNLEWTVAPVSADHWLDTAFPYWEGPVKIQGATDGRGYLELTGY